MSKYVTMVNGIDLFHANDVTCAYLVFGIENVHPAILQRVREWQAKQSDNQYWANPLHC